MLVLGLGHQARTGKDVVAGYLVKNYDFKLLRCAQRLYDDLHNLPQLVKESHGKHFDDIPTYVVAYLDHICCGGKPYKERYTMLWWGMIAERIYGPGYFHDHIGQALELHKGSNRKFVVPDVRRSNTIPLLQKYGGVMVKVVRPEAVNYVGVDRGHWTETQLENFEFDHVIDNSRDLDHLYKQVDALIEKVS